MPLFAGKRLRFEQGTLGNVCGTGLIQASGKIFVIAEGGEPVQIIPNTLVVSFLYDEIDTIEKEGVPKEGVFDHGIQTGRPFERLSITVKA
jgi:hypothetical protein